MVEYPPGNESGHQMILRPGYAQCFRNDFPVFFGTRVTKIVHFQTQGMICSLYQIRHFLQGALQLRR